MVDNQAKTNPIDELCKNIEFQNQNGIININSGQDLFNYINAINKEANKISKKYNDAKNNEDENLIKENEENNIKYFIHLFEYNSNYLFYETISNSIINTIEIPNTINNNKNNQYNNVFILNKVLEEECEYCFEIKLGHSLWNNINDNDKENKKYSQLNNIFKIGLLNLNEKKIKTMSDYLVISELKDINYKVKWNMNMDNALSQQNFDLFCEKYQNYKKNIFYIVDINHLIYSMKNNNFNRFIQKNDIIGVVIKKIKGYIEINIYINGKVASRELIYKEDNIEENNYSDIDDDYNLEKKNKKNNSVLVPFIELGLNKSIFIKDKPNNNNNILSNEKMEYFNKYNSLPLNNFLVQTDEIQKITEIYLDILMKVGNKIFISHPNEVNKYFKQLIIFFNNYTFKNKTIIKSKILSFLSNGINLDNGNISQFKDNLKVLINIINSNEKTNQKKELFELIVSLLLELIIENNFNLLNEYNLSKNKRENNNHIQNIKKNKFILCFLLFDNFMKDKDIKNIFSKESFFCQKKNFMNFCYAIFNSCFYKDSFDAIDYLKNFYNDNKFNKKKFMEFNFNKSIINNNQNNSDKLFIEFIQDYNFIIQNMINNIIFEKNMNQFLFFNFILNFIRSSEDNISITNGIIIQLIQNYFENVGINIGLPEVNKLLNINYINEQTNKCIPKINENTFFGKYNFDILKKKYSSLLKNNVNEKEIKDYLIFELIVNCISYYYLKFSVKEKSAKYYIDLISNNRDNINNFKSYQINQVNNMIDFYQIIFTGNFYLNLVNYGNYFMKIIGLCMKNNYLEILPYKPYLNNILFILDYLYLRCSFIEKSNLIESNEPNIISSLIKSILKYTIEFLGKNFLKVKPKEFTLEDNYEELLSLHIKILIKCLKFDIGAFKHALPEVKESTILLFKNLLEVYDKSKRNILYHNINLLIEFLYYYDEEKEHIKKEAKQIFIKDIMKQEIEDFSKNRNEKDEKRNTYIENTLYYYIFMIIYKRTKIVRNSLKDIFNHTQIFSYDLLYIKKYLVKFTQIMNILYNFLKDNKLNMFYDIKCTLFLKINSFICKTFQTIYQEKDFKNYKIIFEKNDKIMDNFFTQFFFLLSLLLLNHQEQFNYNYKIAKNRKGFYFDEFKQNFKNYFGFQKYKMMNEFLDILSNNFKSLCNDNDTLKAEEVDDNSVDIDHRDTCPICLEFITEKDVHLNDCNHQYHLECLKLQISRNYTKCSLCKQPITGIIEDPTFKVESNNNNNINNNLNSNYLFSLNNNNNIFLSNREYSLFAPVSNHSIFADFNSTGLFSNNNTNNNTGSGGLFGNANNNTSVGLFGNNNRNTGLFGDNNSNTGLFGDNNPNTSLFGNNNQNTGLFGNNNSNTSLFGNNNQNTGLFGNNNQNTGLFGNNNSNNSLFGNNNSNPGLFGTSLFGDNNSNTGLFG